MIGCNSRLDTLQAAILRVKLRNFDNYLQSRKDAGHLYHQLLEAHPRIIRPFESNLSSHTYNQYIIRLKERDRVKDALSKANIPTMVYYPSPLHLQKAYAYLGYREGDFPVAERLCQEVLALPIHTELTLQEQEFIIDSLIQSVNSI
jgi:dTDP-4-amino-4,6-dideoxygalactose transaminase